MFWGVEYFNMLNILSLQGNYRYFEGWNIVLANFRFFRGEYSSHHDHPPSHHYHQSLLHIYFPKLFLFWHYLILKEMATLCTFISFAPPKDSDRRNWWYGRKNVNFHCIYVRENTSKHTDRVFEKEKLFKLRCSKKNFSKWYFPSTQLVVVFKLTQNCKLSQTC